MDTKSLIESLARDGRLQEARRAGEEAIATDPHDDRALEALVNVYLEIEEQCIRTGVTCYLPDIAHRLDELLASMADCDKARRRHRLLQLSGHPLYRELTELETLSARDGNEREAYDKAHSLVTTTPPHPHLLEIYATILYRWARVAMTDPSSRPVKEALFEYLGLPTQKPSRLHSLVLRLAVRCARKYPDFNFTRFFDLWNPRTLRDDDISDPDGKYPLAAAAFELVIDSDQAYEFPALLSRVKATSGIQMSIIRQAFVALVSRNIKASDTSRAIDLLELYANHPALHACDANHSRLLSLALKVMTGDNMWRFVKFLVNWNTSLLRQADTSPSTNTDGTVIPSLASRAMNRCFSALKADVARHEHLLPAVLDTLDNISLLSSRNDDELTTRRRAMLMSWMRQDNEAITRMSEMAACGNRSPSFWLDFADIVRQRDIKMGLLALALINRSNNPSPALDEDIARVRLSLAQLMHAQGNDRAAATELSQCATATEPIARYGAIKATIPADTEPFYSNELEYHRLAAEALAMIYSKIKSETLSVIGRSDNIITLAGASAPPVNIDCVLWPTLRQVTTGDNVEVKRNGPETLMARPVDKPPYHALRTLHAIVIDNGLLQCAELPKPIHCDTPLPGLHTAVSALAYIDHTSEYRALSISTLPLGHIMELFPKAITTLSPDRAYYTAGPDGPHIAVTDTTATPGDTLKAFFYKERSGTPRLIGTAPMPNGTPCDAIKEVSGKLTATDETGQIRDVTIPADLLRASALEPGTYAIARAIYSPATHSWQAITLSPYISDK